VVSKRSLDIAPGSGHSFPMISRVTIANYKSIEAADFETRRVNVFIGEPNSGKSNLLETIGFLSPGVLDKLRMLFRLQNPADMFLNMEIEKEIQVQLTDLGGWNLAFDRKSGVFKGGVGLKSNIFTFMVNRDGGIQQNWASQNSQVFFYRYHALTKGQWDATQFANLSPPFGANLPNLLYTDKKVRDSISAFFRSKGYRLELRPQDNEILMSQEVDDVLYSFPFESISETMRRIVFYKAALESNTDAILVFDEPESNTFPFYTKYLAERIALDTSNQFFLTTHNPYVLMSIIEKTPQPNLAVFVTRMVNYRTEVRLMDQQACEEALDLGMDLFLNLDRFFPE
jgi:predicted ATPase